MEFVSGLLYEYYFVCRRKMWYSAHGISMEEENENVQVGKVIDETSYSRERKHILIGDSANIDFLKDHTVYEVKKSSKLKEAAISQIKYYLYVLWENNVKDVTGEFRVPEEKYTEKVTLTEEDRITIQKNIRSILECIQTDSPPPPINSKICKSCAYYELCYI